MSNVHPATIQDRVISEINLRLATGRPIGECDIFWLNSISIDANKLLKVEAVSGYIALAGLAQLQLNEDEAREKIKCATNLRCDPYTLSQKFVILSNFGYFSEVLPLIDMALMPGDGYFIEHYHAIYGAGAFQKLLSFQDKAASMKIDLGGLPTDVLKKAANILNSASISDEKAASIMDIAGAMLRDNKLIAAGDVDLAVDDDFGHLPVVFLTIPINVDSDVAADMTFELCEKILSQDPQYSPSFNVGFRAKSVS